MNRKKIVRCGTFKSSIHLFTRVLTGPPLPPGVGVTQQLHSVQVFPAGGEHSDRRVLYGWRLPAAALPGPLPVDEGPGAVPQPAGQAQVSVNHITHNTPELSH